jgi:hypothetical protein
LSRFVVGSLRLENWYTQADFPWLPAGAVIADAVRDLRPEDGVLSVYEVDDNTEAALIQRIVVAVAAGSQNPRDVGYLQFERGAVEALGVQINVVPGLTGDADVNALHRDLEQLSAEKLGQLAGVMAHGRSNEILAKPLRAAITVEVRAGRLAPEGVSTTLRKELGL